MAQTFTTLFRDGQQYMQTWPIQKQLYGFFPECRVISATKLSMKTMPPLAVLSVTVSYYYSAFEYLPQAITTAAFLLSLPFQGLLWLGHRSNQPLPPATNSWYQDIHQKMQLQGCVLRSPEVRPKYRELAILLKTAFDELDKVFTKQWF